MGLVKSFQEMSVQELMAEWNVAAMLSDEALHRSDGMDDPHDGYLNKVEEELNSRGLGLGGVDPGQIVKDETRDGTTYRCWFQLMKSEFGNAAWGATNMSNGVGEGGFTKTLTQANLAISEYIEIDIFRRTGRKWCCNCCDFKAQVYDKHEGQNICAGCARTDGWLNLIKYE